MSAALLGQVILAAACITAVLGGLLGLVYEVPPDKATEPLYGLIPIISWVSLALGVVGTSILAWLWARQVQAKAKGPTSRLANAILAVVRTLRRIRLVLLPEGVEGPRAKAPSRPASRPVTPDETELAAPASVAGNDDEPTYIGSAKMTAAVKQLMGLQKEADPYIDGLLRSASGRAEALGSDSDSLMPSEEGPDNLTTLSEVLILFMLAIPVVAAALVIVLVALRWLRYRQDRAGGIV